MKLFNLMILSLVFGMASQAFADYSIRCGKKTQVLVVLDSSQKDGFFVSSRLCKAARNGLTVQPYSQTEDQVAVALENEQARCLYTFSGISECQKHPGEPVMTALNIKGIEKTLNQKAQANLSCLCISE